MNSSPRRTPILVAWLVAALGLGAGVGAIAYATLSDESPTVVRQVTVTSSEPAAAGTALAIGDIYERSRKAVVEITAAATQFSGSQSAQGSGFVYDDEGHIVTNQHVVEGASSISVRFWDGSTRKAEIVGTDASTDLAVIKVQAPASFLDPLQLGDSSGVDVGDGVVALGSPFGLEGTVTSGIVSALHRQMTAPNNFTITDSIQTDAAINHGNSGGPLLDQGGRVIGVNAQIESESGGSDGVGFAIPSNTVRSIVSQLIDSGEAEHAYLGISMLPVPDGVAVTEVHSGTPAEKAGLKPATGTRTVDGQEVPSGGDVIVEFDGRPITTSAELQSGVDAKQPGDTVSVTVLRNGDRRTIEVTLGTQPDRVPQP
jgi:putative serine protease PepD